MITMKTNRKLSSKQKWKFNVSKTAFNLYLQIDRYVHKRYSQILIMKKDPVGSNWYLLINILPNYPISIKSEKAYFWCWRKKKTPKHLVLHFWFNNETSITPCLLSKHILKKINISLLLFLMIKFSLFYAVFSSYVEWHYIFIVCTC